MPQDRQPHAACAVDAHSAAVRRRPIRSVTGMKQATLERGVKNATLPSASRVRPARPGTAPSRRSRHFSYGSAQCCQPPAAPPECFKNETRRRGGRVACRVGTIRSGRLEPARRGSIRSGDGRRDIVRFAVSRRRQPGCLPFEIFLENRPSRAIFNCYISKYTARASIPRAYERMPSRLGHGPPVSEAFLWARARARPSLLIQNQNNFDRTRLFPQK